MQNKTNPLYDIFVTGSMTFFAGMWVKDIDHSPQYLHVDQEEQSTSWSLEPIHHEYSLRSSLLLASRAALDRLAAWAPHGR